MRMPSYQSSVFLQEFSSALAVPSSELGTPRSQSSGLGTLEDRLELQVHSVSADRDIIASNLTSAVNQALAMMGQRDAAVGKAKEAEAAAAAAREVQRSLQSQVGGAAGLYAEVSALSVVGKAVPPHHAAPLQYVAGQ